MRIIPRKVVFEFETQIGKDRALEKLQKNVKTREYQPHGAWFTGTMDSHRFDVKETFTLSRWGHDRGFVVP